MSCARSARAEVHAPASEAPLPIDHSRPTHRAQPTEAGLGVAPAAAGALADGVAGGYRAGSSAAASSRWAGTPQYRLPSRAWFGQRLPDDVTATQRPGNSSSASVATPV